MQILRMTVSPHTQPTASSSHWVASGWSYSGESVYTSGATAYLSATISGSTTIPVDITLTCDPYGNIY